MNNSFKYIHIKKKKGFAWEVIFDCNVIESLDVNYGNIYPCMPIMSSYVVTPTSC
jgi:hypothetical protein